MTTFLTLGLLSYLGSGSGSIITDADPHQNDTDPKHCLQYKINTTK